MLSLSETKVMHQYPSSEILKDSKNLKLDVTQAGESVSFEVTSKEIELLNLGANKVYISFDNESATVNSFPILKDQSKTIKIQAIKLNAICDTSSSADLRILVKW